MRLLFLFFLFPGFLALNAQNADTSIYSIVSEMPRFPGCEAKDTTAQAKYQCSQTALLSFFNRNIAYPLEARQQNTEGTVVLSFVVEKDGFISQPVLLKDIGGGCGDEALRVANGMNEALKQAKLSWVPGKQDGKPVRTKITVPIKFRLQEPPEFIMVKYDTVYVVLDDSISYKGGNAALSSFLKNKLKYPANHKDSCKVGMMDMTLLVQPEGLVKVLDVTDYWNLGFDFQFEAISAATATYGNWTPAKRKGRPVPASFDVSVSFTPTHAGCAQTIADFNQANRLSEEGSELFNEGKQEEGLVKLNQALALFPNNANFLYLRGQAYLNMDKKAEACADFKKVKSLITIEMVNQLIPLLCE
jgi:hypothetical protein